MISSLMDDEVHENVILPELPYVTDEHGSKSSNQSLFYQHIVIDLSLVVLSL